MCEINIYCRTYLFDIIGIELSSEHINYSTPLVSNYKISVMGIFLECSHGSICGIFGTYSAEHVSPVLKQFISGMQIRYLEYRIYYTNDLVRQLKLADG